MKNLLVIFCMTLMLLPLGAATFSSDGLPDGMSLMFGSTSTSSDTYYSPYVDSDGKLRIDTADTVSSVTITEMSTCEVLETVEVVSEVSNVTSVDTVDTITDITGGTIDTVTSITGGSIDIDYLTEGFLTEVARGNVSGVDLWNLTQINDTLPTSKELISPASTIEQNAAAAATVYISSSSATDDKDLQGVQSVKIWGINGSDALISEEINIEGKATVETTASFKYIIKAAALTEGTSGQVGDLYIHKNASITDGVPDDTTSTYLKIPIGYGSSGNGKFFVPSGDTAVLIDANVSCSGTGPYVVYLFSKKDGAANNLLGVYCLDDGADHIPLNIPLEALEYIHWEALSANAGDDIAVSFRVLLY